MSAAERVLDASPEAVRRAIDALARGLVALPSPPSTRIRRRVARGRAPLDSLPPFARVVLARASLPQDTDPPQESDRR